MVMRRLANEITRQVTQPSDTWTLDVQFWRLYHGSEPFYTITRRGEQVRIGTITLGEGSFWHFERSPVGRALNALMQLASDAAQGLGDAAEAGGALVADVASGTAAVAGEVASGVGNVAVGAAHTLRFFGQNASWLVPVTAVLAIYLAIK